MSTSVALKQISRAKSEALASLGSARSARNQWLAASGQNPTSLTQREIETINRAFKNRLLSVKWDCEDLEELISQNGAALKQARSQEFEDAKIVLEECKREIEKSTLELDDFESSKKNYAKHGIAPQPTTATQISNPMAEYHNGAQTKTLASVPTSHVTSIIPNPFHRNQQHERLLKDDDGDSTCAGGGGCDETVATSAAVAGATDELHFDKRQVETSTTIFENALYEHYESGEFHGKGFQATQVFNNLTRPNTDADVYAGPNENEMILEMLETDYYNSPPGLLAKAKYSVAIRRLFSTDRGRFLGTLLIIFSFPILMMLLLVI